VPGRVILVNPEDVHDGGPATADCAYSYRMFYLDPEALRETASEAAGRRVGLPFFARAVVTDPDLSDRILTLHRALEAPHSLLERDGRFAEALLGLVLRHAGGRLASEPDRSAPHPLDPALDFLAHHFTDDVSLAMLADLVGIDRFRFLRQFRRRFGLPPHAYQTLLRLRHAKALLRAGETAASAALAAGFADQSHMIRKFKAVYGVTPGRYQSHLQ
jgi:AraC-like DNA-binding protein